MSKQVQAHVHVIGDVIGVGFRAWTKIEAKITGVNGWVRNCHEKSEVFGPGGGVEVFLQGDEEKVEKMIELLRQGPPVSRVDDIEIFWQEPKELMRGFEMRK
jgi:acylphosphatase